MNIFGIGTDIVSVERREKRYCYFDQKDLVLISIFILEEDKEEEDEEEES